MNRRERRIYDHERFPDGSIMFADKNSMKSKYGHDAPEAYPANDPRFLQEVMVDMGNQPPRLACILTPPSEGHETQNWGRIGAGVVIVEQLQPSGGWVEMGTHESRILREFIAILPHAFIEQKTDA